jgi:hypothetical protein
LNGGNKQYSCRKRSHQDVVEDGYWQVVVVLVVFEAAFAEVQCGESAHAEGAFFAVVAGSKAPEEFEDTVDSDEHNYEENHAGAKVVE